jgi:hypothetical protein
MMVRLEVENDIPLTPHCTSSVSQQMDTETDRVPQNSLPGRAELRGLMGSRAGWFRAWALCENSRGIRYGSKQESL